MATRKNPMGFMSINSSMGRGRVTPPKTMAKKRGSISKIHGPKKIVGGKKSHGRNY